MIELAEPAQQIPPAEQGHHVSGKSFVGVLVGFDRLGVFADKFCLSGLIDEKPRLFPEKVFGRSSDGLLTGNLRHADGDDAKAEKNCLGEP
ncbi:MAG: hypothetical protein BWY66_00954 [bacterium ADurb.Bin374]|nr:MAG: hypothetical protein BWY66_00954 [bacterium ADurb.Bin374]